MAKNLPDGTVRPSLMDFGAHNKFKTGSRPWLETIPEWEECLSGWQEGLSAAQIRLWLTDVCGYSPEVATVSKVAHLSRVQARRRGL